MPSAPRNDAGGYILLLAVFSILVLSVLGSVLTSGATAGLKGMAGQLEAVQAQAVADGGMRWVFQQNLAGDTNLSDNVSPANPPLPANAITLGAGKFWVEYFSQTATSMDVRVTARVGNAERAIRARVDLASSRPLERLIYNDGDLNIGSMAVGPTGADIETTDPILSPLPGWADVPGVSRIIYASPYNRLIGPKMDWFQTNANQVVDASALPGGTLTFNPTGSPYGDAVNGYIWYVQGGSVTIDGQFGQGVTINGTVVMEANPVLTINDPVITWTAPDKVIGMTAVAVPAIVATSVNLSFPFFGNNFNGAILMPEPAGSVQIAINGGFSGAIWSRGAVTISHTGGWFTYSWPASALNPPWLLIEGPDPDVEYKFTQWQEEPSS